MLRMSGTGRKTITKQNSRLSGRDCKQEPTVYTGLARQTALHRPIRLTIVGVQKCFRGFAVKYATRVEILSDSISLKQACSVPVRVYYKACIISVSFRRGNKREGLYRFSLMEIHNSSG